jgi:hypothetical protein
MGGCLPLLVCPARRSLLGLPGSPPCRRTQNGASVVTNCLAVVASVIDRSSLDQMNYQSRDGKVTPESVPVSPERLQSAIRVLEYRNRRCTMQRTASVLSCAPGGEPAWRCTVKMCSRQMSIVAICLAGCVLHGDHWPPRTISLKNSLQPGAIASNPAPRRGCGPAGTRAAEDPQIHQNLGGARRSDRAAAFPRRCRAIVCARGFTCGRNP